MNSKNRLHVEIGIDGVSNSVVDLHGSYMDLLIAATYIINVFTGRCASTATARNSSATFAGT